MWAKFKQYLDQRKLEFKKQKYLELLEEFDHPHVTLEHMPLMLVSFWNQFDISTLKNILPAEWMYIDLKCRHNNIAELIFALQDFTNAIAQDDYTVIEHASKERFVTSHEMDLDTYITGVNGEILKPLEAFKALQDNVKRHGEIIDTVTVLAYRRLLHRFYQDLHALTVTLVNNIKA